MEHLTVINSKIRQFDCFDRKKKCTSSNSAELSRTGILAKKLYYPELGRKAQYPKSSLSLGQAVFSPFYCKKHLNLPKLVKAGWRFLI